MFVKSSLELIKSSESVIEKIVNSKRPHEAAAAMATAAAESESGGEGSFSSADETSVAKTISKKSKKLKTKLGKTIKNVFILSTT